jgi:hypothetical protein
LGVTIAQSCNCESRLFWSGRLDTRRSLPDRILHMGPSGLGESFPQ